MRALAKALGPIRVPAGRDRHCQKACDKCGSEQVMSRTHFHSPIPAICNSLSHTATTRLAQSTDVLPRNFKITLRPKLRAIHAMVAGPPDGVGTQANAAEHFVVSFSIIPTTSA